MLLTQIMRPWMLLLLLCAAAAANPLPREVAARNVELIRQSDHGGRKIWHTRHFQIDHDVDLGNDALDRIARIAETTAAVLRAHSLPLFAPPLKGRPRISIHGDDSAYEQAGGAKGSAGFYLGNFPGTAMVVIRGNALFNPAHAGGSRLPPQNDEDLIVHELVHLCMHRVNSGIPQWLAEGVAEYFASAHRGGGRFSFANMDSTIRDHLRIRLSPDDPRIPLVRVAAIASLDSEEWLAYIKELPEEKRYYAYSSALILAHYHLHGGKQRHDQLRDLLEKAPTSRRPPPFLIPESGPAIESLLARYWQPKGLALVFSD